MMNSDDVAELAQQTTFHDIQVKFRQLGRTMAAIEGRTDGIAKELCGPSTIDFDRDRTNSARDNAGLVELVASRLDDLIRQAADIRIVLNRMDDVVRPDAEEAEDDVSEDGNESIEGSYADLKAARDRLRAEVSPPKSPYPPAGRARKARAG